MSDQINQNTNQSEAPELWNYDDVAAFLKMQPGTIRKFVSAGRIPYRKIGTKTVRFVKSEIVDLALNGDF